MSTESRAVEGFRDHFGGDPEFVVTSPGRVNLIGEHTDYNEGFVLPMAIDRATVIAGRARTDRTVEVASEGFGTAAFSLDNLEHGGESWIEYIKGVAWACGPDATGGFDAYITSDIPLGASLSSSAALEVGVARVFSQLLDADWDPIAAAGLSQRAENDWVGMNSGIMDQLVCAAGQSGQALLIDCRTLDVVNVPIPPEVNFVILDTGTRRKLTESRYNERRRECEQAAERFGVDSLRDLALEALVRPGFDDPILIKRAHHVVTENARTLQAVDALRVGDVRGFGRLMVASHESLRDDFEVSSGELDVIVEAASAIDGCQGARMTGGGFAGCAVALVEKAATETFSERVAQSYLRSTGRESSIYVCEPAEGVSAREYSVA